jgi:hypothetical protein
MAGLKKPDLNAGARWPGDLAFAALFFAFALFLLSRIGAETQWVQRSILFAQPRFWPAVGLCGMTFFGAIHLVGSWRSRGVREDRAVQEIGLWLHSLEFAAWFMVYVLTTPIVGYLPATLVFTVLLAWRMGYRSRVALCSALGMGAAIVILFKSLLQVRIPGGAIYQHLPDALRNFMILYL